MLSIKMIKFSLLQPSYNTVGASDILKFYIRIQCKTFLYSSELATMTQTGFFLLMFSNFMCTILRCKHVEGMIHCLTPK